MRIKHERKFYIPKDYVLHKKTEHLEVYFHPEKPCAIGFRGKAQKPTFNFIFKTADQRQKFVDEQFRAAEELAQRRAEPDLAANHYAIGDILYSSWGYEQTNIDFYQVTALVGTQVELTALYSIETPGEGISPMAGYVVPDLDALPTKKPFRKTVKKDGSISFTHGGAYKWDGKPKYCSHYA